MIFKAITKNGAIDFLLGNKWIVDILSMKCLVFDGKLLETGHYSFATGHSLDHPCKVQIFMFVNVNIKE